MDSDEDEIVLQPKRTGSNEVKPTRCGAAPKRGDATAYMREAEAERRYFFSTLHRLAIERCHGDSTILHVTPWKWSENALLFRK